MATTVWSISNKKLENQEAVISSAYKDANGNNKLSTITSSNPTGYLPIAPASSDPVAKKISYAVQNNGKITYQYDDGTGNKTQYNSIQQIANDGLKGYTSASTTIIKGATQARLSQQVTAYNAANPTTKIDPGRAQTNPATPTNGATPTTTVKDANSFNVASEYAAPGNFENLVYPTSSRSSISFDYIKFTPLVYGTRAIKDNAVSFSKTRSLVNAGGSVSLAIQSGITDSNGVGWNEQSANPIQLGAAGVSAQLQNGQTDVVERVISALQENSANKQVSSSVRSMLQLYFAGQAVNANIATKITGAIINPNLELLFNGPQLRPFTFNFKLSPRDQDESKEVKKILRFFKQNMAVRRGVKDLFLKSPNVFNIEYLYKKNTPHGGLNKFKSCALQNFSVDYTPEGSYATFYEDSGNGSMVSYNISLTFMELEPIYSDDYPADKSIIGY
jgi:hypothetical protein